MIFDRLYYEGLENENLAKYAVLASKSKGRVYKEPDDDYRTAFQRDRDRIVHSKAFRRLKHKTQVFIIFEGDHFRTRLTHTLEVTQISRHIARMLGLNEDLVETISLAHDLGHTPFGHAGEAVLNEYLKDEGGFEHNNQSKRLVEYLELKYPDFPGLNLSLEVLEGLMKHFTPFDHPKNVESQNFIFPSLEAQVVNLADQLAYMNHDLDDGVASGIIEMNDLITKVDLWHEADKFNASKYSSLTTNQKRFLNVRYLINMMVKDVVTETNITLTKYNINNIDDVYGCQNRLVDFSDPLLNRIANLRMFLKDKFYNDTRILEMMKKGRLYIEELFLKFVESPQLLPESEQQRVFDNNIKRVAADYISQMTDNYVIKEHKRVFG